MPRALPRVLGAFALVVVVVAPIAYMLVPPSNPDRELEDFLTSLIAALGVTGGVLLRRRDSGDTAVAVLLGAATGLLMALVISSTNARGFGVLVPPTAGFALGLLDRIGDRPLQGFRQPVGYGAALGGLIGLGLVMRQSFTVIGIAALIGAIVGVYLGVWTPASDDARGRIRRPPPGLAALWILVLTLATLQIRTEFADGRSQANFLDGGLLEAFLQTSFMLIVTPIIALVCGINLARWLKPRLAVYRELVDDLRVMYVPIGAFSIGSAFIVVIFAGIYGSLYRLWDGHFVAMTDLPTTSDWIFFAIYTSVAADFSTIAPVSNVAHLMVATQVLIGIGWAVVMFAAVMTLVQPRLARLTRDERPPEE